MRPDHLTTAMKLAQHCGRHTALCYLSRIQMRAQEAQHKTTLTLNGRTVRVR